MHDELAELLQRRLPLQESRQRRALLNTGQASKFIGYVLVGHRDGPVDQCLQVALEPALGAQGLHHAGQFVGRTGQLGEEYLRHRPASGGQAHSLRRRTGTDPGSVTRGA
jgi:hypothetical protein